MAKAAANKKTAAKASSAKGGKMLVIVESPSKAKTIGKYLGSKYKVVASVGHVRDLPKSKLGIDIENNFENTCSALPYMDIKLRILIFPMPFISVRAIS